MCYVFFFRVFISIFLNYKFVKVFLKNIIIRKKVYKKEMSNIVKGNIKS